MEKKNKNIFALGWKKLTAMVLCAILLVGCGVYLTSCTVGKEAEEVVSGNMWIVKAGDPTDSVDGNAGDMYLDSDTYDLYQMTGSGWVKLGNLSGPKGEDGVTPTVKIGVDGYWVINDVKTNVRATGGDTTTGTSASVSAAPTVEINKDGYWVINGTVTVVKAEGVNGAAGKDGVDGITPTVAISDDGYWVINGVKSSVKASGEDGKTPTVAIDSDGYWIINGENTGVIAGATMPTIEIIDGYWYINGNNTQVPATGEKGEPGTDGEDGADGITPTIEISDDGYWVINGVKSDVKATGTDGANGTNGTDGKDGTAWFTGTEVTGTDSNISATVDGAKVGDIYLNTETSDIYVCTAENTWEHVANIKGDKGDQGDAGTNGTNGSNGTDGTDGSIWYFGASSPDSSLGKDGDCYLDTTKLFVYTKANSEWTRVANLNAKQEWNEDGVLKILSIGNSFSVDAQQYLYQIASDMGVEKIKLGNLYEPSCTIDTHYTYLKNDMASYNAYYTNENGTWVTTDIKTSKAAIESENWDYITFQQGSGSSGKADTYTRLQELMDMVEVLCPKAKFVWHMTWAYQGDSTHSSFVNYNNNQMTMYNAIIDTVESQILTNDRFELVIPNGTAIQNARTSLLGDTLTRDGYHLDKGVGRYIAALSFARVLTGLPIDNVDWVPTGEYAVTEQERLIAIESVNNAVANPYEVTQSEYVEINLASMTRVELDLTSSAYYWSTNSSNHYNLVTTVANCSKFWATQKFEKEDLPVGSVLVVADGWQYRPEGWVDGAINSSSSRPGNVTTSQVVVDEAWWGDYTERGFNISRVDNSDISGYTEDQINEAFQIYIPAN